MVRDTLGVADRVQPGVYPAGGADLHYEGLRGLLPGPSGERQEGRRPADDQRGGDRSHRYGAQDLQGRPARPRVRGADHSQHQAGLFALEFENSRFNPASRPEIGPCVGTRQPKKENERLLFENQRT